MEASFVAKEKECETQKEAADETRIEVNKLKQRERKTQEQLEEMRALYKKAEMDLER